jgi:hypothetical protein
LQIQPQFIPYLGVYIVDEEMGPDGDINCGHIRFRHGPRIGFSVIINNNDQLEGELKIDAAFWALMNGLWRDPDLTNFINSTMPDNTRMEGIESGVRKHEFGFAGANEQPFAELQYVARVIYRAEYAPIITTDLLRIHVESVPNLTGGPVPPADEVQRIISEYEFTPAKGGTDGRAAN